MQAVNQNRRWNIDQERTLQSLASHDPDTLKTVLGRTKHGLRRRLTILSLSKMTQAGKRNGYSSRDLALAFGFSHVKIADLVSAGYLHGQRVRVWKRQVFTFSSNDAIAFLQQHAGLFQFNPSRKWKPVVEEAQRYFHEKYISTKEIHSRYGLTSRQVQIRKRNQGFPQPTSDFRQSSATGLWYNRAAVECWIVENA